MRENLGKAPTVWNGRKRNAERRETKRWELWFVLMACDGCDGVEHIYRQKQDDDREER